MKYLILVFALSCGSAHATNILFSPVSPTTYFYLTDQQTEPCTAGTLWHNIQQTSDNGDSFGMGCWRFADRGKMVEISGGSHESVNRTVLSDFRPVPGAGKQLYAVWHAYRQTLGADREKTLLWQNAHPHP